MMLCDAPDDTLVPLSLLATALGLSRGWLLGEALAGRIPCLRAGKQLLFNLDAVKAALAARAATETLTGEGEGGDD
jgi:hypothetical protein